MEIIRRYKNSQGKTVKYDVMQEGKVITIKASTARDISNMITNAYLTKYNEFRAKRGFSIETIVLHNSSRVRPRKNVLVVADSNTEVNTLIPTKGNFKDCYGFKYVKICRQIRQLAREGKFVIDGQHKSNGGRNTHMFALIEACGVSVSEFIQGYLSNLQPYSLSEFQGNSRKRVQMDKTSIWLNDIGYGIKLVIKLDLANTNKPLVVSFHEDNIFNKNTVGNHDFSDKPCAVLIDKVVKHDDFYSVDYVIQRGFLVHRIHSVSYHFVKDWALVNYRDIKLDIEDTLQALFEKLQSIYVSDKVYREPLSAIRLSSGKVSFLSMGFASVNNIYLLIDLFASYTDGKSRKALSHLALCIKEEIPIEKWREIQSALEIKLHGSNNELYLSLLDK